jgi:Tfp pilus assembly protein PilN
MRPVNLIPPEERRGEHAPIRTGPVAYLVIGALALALGAVTLLVLTNNKISDREAKVAELNQRQTIVNTQADELTPFAQFSTVEEQRTATIRSLADSRFDWERVMRELARVIPSDVWLTGLTGTVSSEVEIDGGANVDTRSSVQGPALELTGCAKGHKGVAEFLSALQDIDGVTRVGLSDSQRPGADASSSSSSSTTTSSSSGGTASDCRNRDFISQFQIVAAFDEVPTPAIPEAAPSSATTPPPSTSTGSTATATPTSGATNTG